MTLSKTLTTANSMNSGDLISYMPNEILHNILSFLSTKLAIKTLLLSKRWRQLWCETPCLYIDDFQTIALVNQALVSHIAPKITSFYLHISFDYSAPQINSLIKFVVSGNVSKLSLKFDTIGHTYIFPDFFYLNSSLTQLSVNLVRSTYGDMIPKCKVYWPSLRNLLLSSCNLSEEFVANILFGSPNLERLTMSFCGGLSRRLDLSNALSLKRLGIVTGSVVPGPAEVVAPHVHYLRLLSPRKLCTLVDVSSLTQADIDIYTCLPLNTGFRQTMMVLEKLRNVEWLTVGATVLEILSLAELHGVPFPTLKVQNLRLKTDLVLFVMPSIAKLLQNSHGLKKLTVDTIQCCNIVDTYLDSYLDSEGLDLDQCWRSKYNDFPTKDRCFMWGNQNEIVEPLASFVKLVLRNIKTLESVVIWLRRDVYFDKAKWFEEHLEMVSQYKNVSIEIKSEPSTNLH